MPQSAAICIILVQLLSICGTKIKLILNNENRNYFIFETIILCLFFFARFFLTDFRTALPIGLVVVEGFFVDNVLRVLEVDVILREVEDAFFKDVVDVLRALEVLDVTFREVDDDIFGDVVDVLREVMDVIFLEVEENLDEVVFVMNLLKEEVVIWFHKFLKMI
jgi:hypothetical protein